MGKIVTLDELKRTLESDDRTGRTVVFTNGCFDLLHPGHVDYLDKAKAMGDILVVGVNSDQSVTKLKGKGRPVMPQEARMKVLAALGSVDFVVGFSEVDPSRLISAVKPDIHVKGGDYKVEDLPEAKIVKEYGGEVVIVPFVDGYSSSFIIDKLQGEGGRVKGEG